MELAITYEVGNWVLMMYGKRYVFNTLDELWALARPEVEHEADQ